MAIDLKPAPRRLRPGLSASSDVPFGRFARGARIVADQMEKNLTSFCATDVWTPDVNLYELPDAYLVCVDLSGVEKQKIDLTVKNQSLMIRGERRVPRPPAAAHRPVQMRVHLMEIDHGSFSREVALPADVHREAILAVHRNGLLWIELPKV